MQAAAPRVHRTFSPDLAIPKSEIVARNTHYIGEHDVDRMALRSHLAPPRKGKDQNSSRRRENFTPTVIPRRPLAICEKLIASLPSDRLYPSNASVSASSPYQAEVGVLAKITPKAGQSASSAQTGRYCLSLSVGSWRCLLVLVNETYRRKPPQAGLRSCYQASLATVSPPSPPARP
jgi:hypothetical protein